jgi:hypothetical protein
MKKLFAALLLTCLCTLCLFAGLDFAAIDSLYFHERIDEVQAELEKLNAQSGLSNEDKAKVLWRLSRNCVDLGDRLADNQKNEKYAIYEKGQSLAEESISYFETPDAYIWKCSNLGRWGQTKGPLNSLAKAKPMYKDLEVVVNKLGYLDSSDVWYVLGSLFDQLPGSPISFGDSKAAVSYMRMAVEKIPSWVYYGGTYKYLATMLYARDWSASKRSGEFAKMLKSYEKQKTTIEQYKYYEGKLGDSYVPFYCSTPLSQMSDREEAVKVLEFAVSMYSKRSFHTPGDDESLAEIKSLLASWK